MTDSTETVATSDQAKPSHGALYLAIENLFTGSHLRRWVSAFLCSAAFISAASLWVNQPIEPPRLTNEEIVAGWGEAISRFGITPIFPPQEDVTVGDVWATIEFETKDPPPQRASGEFSQTFLGRSIKIGNMNLMKSQPPRQQFKFSQTKLIGGKVSLEQDEIFKIDPPGDLNEFRTKIVALPRISINYKSSREAESGFSNFFKFATRKSSLSLDDTFIPIVETYGVDADLAISSLKLWCQTDENSLVCTDAYLRRVFAYVFGSQAVPDSVRIAVKAVNRVYMTRYLAQTRTKIVDVHAETSITPGDGRPESETDPLAAGKIKAKADSKLTVDGNTYSSFGISEQIYPRPIVIGIRAVSVESHK